MSAIVGGPAEPFLHELRSLLSIEDRLARVILPRLRDRARATDLAAALDRHLLETDKHVARLRTVFALVGETETPVESRALEGLLADDATAQHALRDAGGALADLVTIGSVVRLEQLELGFYGTLVHTAEALGLAHDVPRLLRQNMGEDAYALEQAEHALVRLLAEEVESSSRPDGSRLTSPAHG